MATLLNPRDVLLPNPLGAASNADGGQTVPRWFLAAVSATTSEPRIVRQPRRDARRATAPLAPPAPSPVARSKAPATTGPSYVRGVSLPSVLQMLHLERKTCLLEVTAGKRSGTLTLVNGELVDAESDGLEGEAAACRILAWSRPHTTILDGVTLFRHTVKLPIAQLIVEAIRRLDETGPLGPIDEPAPAVGTESLAARATADGDRTWLVESLVAGGASGAAVFRATDDVVLAQAADRSQSASGPDAFTPVLRAACHWARQSFPVVDDVTLRLGNRYALVAPLGERRSEYVCAVYADREAADFARAAIGSITG